MTRETGGVAPALSQQTKQDFLVLKGAATLITLSPSNLKYSIQTPSTPQQSHDTHPQPYKLAVAPPQAPGHALALLICMQGMQGYPFDVCKEPCHHAATPLPPLQKTQPVNEYPWSSKGAGRLRRVETREDKEAGVTCVTFLCVGDVAPS